MNWKPHFLFGFLLFAVLGYVFLTKDFFQLAFLSAVAGLSALLPDLDHELSKSRKITDKLVPILAFVILFFHSRDFLNSILFTLVISGIYFILFTFFKPRHRGITHTLSVLFILSILVYLYNPVLSYAFFVGYLSHLLGDGLIKLL